MKNTSYQYLSSLWFRLRLKGFHTWRTNVREVTSFHYLQSPVDPSLWFLAHFGVFSIHSFIFRRKRWTKTCIPIGTLNRTSRLQGVLISRVVCSACNHHCLWNAVERTMSTVLIVTRSIKQNFWIQSWKCSSSWRYEYRCSHILRLLVASRGRTRDPYTA